MLVDFHHLQLTRASLDSILSGQCRQKMVKRSSRSFELFAAVLFKKAAIRTIALAVATSATASKADLAKIWRQFDSQFSLPEKCSFRQWLWNFAETWWIPQLRREEQIRNFFAWSNNFMQWKEKAMPVLFICCSQCAKNREATGTLTWLVYACMSSHLKHANQLHILATTMRWEAYVYLATILDVL